MPRRPTTARPKVRTWTSATKLKVGERVAIEVYGKREWRVRSVEDVGGTERWKHELERA